MVDFRTRRDGQRFPIRDKGISPANLEAAAKQDKNRGLNERIIQETRKVEIKDPEKKPGTETIVVQEKELDVEIDAGKKK